MKRIINKIRRMLVLIMIKVFVKPFLPKPKLKEKNIGFIVYGGLGDGVLWIQYANQVIEYYESQGCNVYLICNKSVSDLYRNYSNFKHIIVVENNYSEKFRSFKKALIETRLVAFEKLIDIRVTKFKYQDMFIIENAKAKEKIGYYEEYVSEKKHRYQNRIFDKLIKLSEIGHEYNNHYNFLKKIGIETVQNLFYLKPYVKKLNEDNYMVLCVGASDINRIWNLDNWLEVTTYILDKSDLKIYVCGSKQESFVYDYLKLKLNNTRVINMCGNTTLQELINMLGNASFVICNDSGPGHIASSVGAKGLVLLGGGFGLRFFPHEDINKNKTRVKEICVIDKCWNCCWLCSKSSKEFPCIQNIKAEEVVNNIKKLI